MDEAAKPAPEGFDAPWQAQLCAIQSALVDAGVFSSGEWAEVLGDRLRTGKPKSDGSDYYEHYLEALEQILSAKDHAAAYEIEALSKAWRRAARATPHGRPIVLANDPERSGAPG